MRIALDPTQHKLISYNLYRYQSDQAKDKNVID